MKTPRELLLQRHQQAEPKLDRLREGVIAGLAKPESKAEAAPSLICFFARKLWEELVVPSRRIWVGLAAAWMVLLAVNLQMNHSQRNSASSVRTVAAAVKEQRQILTELVQRPLPGPVLASPSEAIRPRSDRRTLFRTC